MGKHTKEKNAFESASSMRTTYIEQLKKCRTSGGFGEISRKYEEKKRKNPLLVALTPHHSEIINGLDKEILELTKKLNAKFFPVASIESSSVTHEQHEVIEEGTHTTAVEVLTEDFAEEHRPPVEKKDSGSEVRVEEVEKRAPAQTQTKNTLELSKASERGEISQTTKTKHVRFDPLLEKEPKSQSTLIREDKHDKSRQENHVDLRAKRHRGVHLAEVRIKLKTLHSKQVKYEEKAKKYRKEGNHKEKEKYQKAAEAAKNIYLKISEFANQYIRDGNLKSFQLSSQGVLSENSEDVKTLQTHRGWWEEFLDELVNLINRGFTRIGSSIRVHELSLFKPAADGGNKITDLRQSISNVAATI